MTPQNSQQHQHSSLSLVAKRSAVAGAVCAFVSATLHPLDTVKIRLQNQAKSNTATLKYKGTFSGIGVILREESVAGLFKGIFPSMLREVFYSSLRIGSYEPIREMISGNRSSLETPPALKFTAAFLAGGGGAAVANPFDLLKTQFQAATGPPPYSSTWAGFLAITSKNGIAGLYKGVSVTSMRAAVLTSAQLGSYDTIKHNVITKYFHLPEGLLLHFCSSMLAGLITTTATNPVDVVKSRYMSDLKGEYKSPIHCIVETYRRGGIRVFFQGWVPAYIRIGPHTVMSLVFMERVRTLLGLGNL